MRFALFYMERVASVCDGPGECAREMRIELFIFIRKRRKKFRDITLIAAKGTKATRFERYRLVFFFHDPMMLHRFVEALIERPHDSDV